MPARTRAELTDSTGKSLAMSTIGGNPVMKVDIASVTIVLPTGASTAAKQDTGNTSLGSIDTKTPSLGQAAMASSVPVVIANNQSAIPVSGPVTDTQLRASAVPVTANAGTNLNTSLLALDSTVTGLQTTQGSTTSGQKQLLGAAAVLTANPAYTTAQSSPLSLTVEGGLRMLPINRYATKAMVNGNGDLDINCDGMGSVVVNFSGTWTGSVNFQASLDGSLFVGTPANSVSLELLSNQVPLTTTANGTFSFNTTGFKTLRMQNVVLTGTATVNIGGGSASRVIDGILATVYTAQSGTWTVASSEALAQASTTSGQSGYMAMTATTTAVPTYVTAKTNPLNTNTSGGLRVDVAQINGVTPLMGAGSTGTGSPRVTISTDQAILTNAWKSNVAQINGITPLMGNGITGTGSQRVTIASDNTAFSVNAVQSGTWTVQPGNTANTTAWKVDGSAVTQPTRDNFQTRADTYTTTASGTTVNVSTAPLSSFSVQVKMTGTVTSWDVRLEGSNDNVNFAQILAHTNVTPGDGLITFSGTAISPVLYFRSRCAGLVLGAGTNVVVTILGIA